MSVRESVRALGRKGREREAVITRFMEVNVSVSAHTFIMKRIPWVK